MTFIQISDLTTAGIELYTGTSFLKELEKTETTQIFGGCYQKSHGNHYKKDEYCCYYEEKCYDSSYHEEKCDDSSYHEEKKDSKHDSGWKKECWS